MAGLRHEGFSGTVQEVDVNRNAQVITPGYASDGTSIGGGDSAAVAMYSEIDNGSVTGLRDTLSPETDDDYRLRVAQDNMLDQELFNYTAQNTGKHTTSVSTMSTAIGASGILTNSASITTNATGLTFGTYAMFPVGGSLTLTCETSIAFSAQPNANTLFDFGLFQRGVSTAFAPLDGVYFRVNSGGVFGVINSGGSEISTAVFPNTLGLGTFAYANNNVNKYLIQINNVRTTFWINNVKMGEIPTPAALNFPCKSLALPWSFRHAIVGGAAGAVFQALVSDYKVFMRGVQFADTMSTVYNRVLGSYQGLSGGLMGSLSNYSNSVNPIAAVPTNTTAALGSGIGGQFWETATLALNTDAIICSYQVPSGSSIVQGRRMRINGVSLKSFIQTAIIGAPYNAQYSLAFGHTSVSLATAESASTKAPRRKALPSFTQLVTIGQAINTDVVQSGTHIQFINPIYVNPGEFIALVTKHIGTVATAGVVAHVVDFDYGWE